LTVLASQKSDPKPYANSVKWPKRFHLSSDKSLLEKARGPAKMRADKGVKREFEDLA
jgi:hypothetical protein